MDSAGFRTVPNAKTMISETRDFLIRHKDDGMLSKSLTSSTSASASFSFNTEGVGPSLICSTMLKWMWYYPLIEWTRYETVSTDITWDNSAFDRPPIHKQSYGGWDRFYTVVMQGEVNSPPKVKWLSSLLRVINSRWLNTSTIECRSEGMEVAR